MAKNWAELTHTRGEVDAAGRRLAAGNLSEIERAAALEILGNWRSTHSFPLNTLQVGLRRYSGQVTPQFIVAQRLKRVTSIVTKLQRFPEMKLSRMQDIGGCRAVVRNVRSVRKLVDLYRNSVSAQKIGVELGGLPRRTQIELFSLLFNDAG